MSKNAYSVAEGHVLRGTEKVAAYDSKTGTLDFLSGKASYRGPVVKFLKSQNLPIDAAPLAPEGESSEPRASRVGVNQDKPREGDVTPENPGGIEPGAPQLPPPEAKVSPKDEAAAAAGQGIIIKDGGKPKFYRDRLTPEGWV